MALIFEKVDGPGLPKGVPIPVTLLFTFERGRIVRFEVHFDHSTAAERFQKLSQSKLPPESDSTTAD